MSQQDRSIGVQSILDDSETETSLVDILRFLKRAWKVMAIFGLIGLALSISYIAITPKQYEAIAKITMAQIGTVNINNPMGINIEEPAGLIARMTLPTSLTPQVAVDCGLGGQINDVLMLSKLIRLTIPKGVANMVELKTLGSTPQAAEKCNLAVFELIKASQSQIVAPYIADSKIKLDNDIERLAKARDFIVKADKSGSAMGAAYLSTRDETRFLLDEITTLQNIILSSRSRVTRLIAPIFASDESVAPKTGVALAAGLFAGLFLGLWIALARSVIARIKSKAGGVL